jgi:hypothetical protein
MATKTVKLNSAECMTCILIGVIGSTIYFMWSDISALWAK